MSPGRGPLLRSKDSASERSRQQEAFGKERTFPLDIREKIRYDTLTSKTNEVRRHRRLLERTEANAHYRPAGAHHKLYGGETALVEINRGSRKSTGLTWKEYELIEPASTVPYRREITWGVFDEKANRVANMLLSRGVKKGDKVAILLMNCLEWLPIYFGILKAGAIAVP